ncbi:MAG: hypothetical protein ACE5HC_16795, partial [Candidatus Binatia bacterium]
PLLSGHPLTTSSPSTRPPRVSIIQDDTYSHIPLAGFAKIAQLQAWGFSGSPQTHRNTGFSL